MILQRKFDKIYNSIGNLNKSFGIYKKAEMHIHTPASHDYRLYSNENAEYYKRLSDLEIIGIAKKEGLFNEIIYNEYKFMLESKQEKEFIKKMRVFTSIKEYIAYLLIVHKLISSKIEVAIITDHNTIDGYSKIKKARDIYLRSRNKGNYQYLHLFLGVEISCGDKNHLVCIFDNNTEIEINNYLKKNINDKEQGTYKTSLQVIEEINFQFNAITYVAHLNSSEIFKSAGVYKKELFLLNDFKYIGLTNILEKDSIQSRIESSIRQQKEFYYLQEGDSHAIDELNIRNVWIKFEKVNFRALKKAFENFNTCIGNEEPIEVEKYIKGIYIISGSYGFLNSKPNAKEKNVFMVNFSKDLNCIIGGRGSGKSTILKFIDTAFTLNAESLGVLKVISSHDTLYIVFHYKGNDYILELIPHVEFDLKGNFRFLNQEWMRKDINYNEPVEINEYWRRLHLVKKVGEDKHQYEEIKYVKELCHRDGILYDFFRSGYSINNLVSKIQDNQVSNVLSQIIYGGIKLEDNAEEIYELIDSKQEKFKNKDINEVLKKIREGTEKNYNHIKVKVEEFNQLHKGTFILEYKSTIGADRYRFSSIPDEGLFKKTILEWEGIKQIVMKQMSKLGMLDYTTYITNKNYDKLEETISIMSLKRNFTQKDVDNGLVDFTKNMLKELYDAIRSKVFIDDKQIIDILETLIHPDNSFNLSFNIANKETNEKGKPIYKYVQRISLGQQVAAILNFIIEFGKFTNDDTPLIIDQPEDNLDNQYIYKNLVASLRNIKNKRQIIIATHSSTIVTNSDTEQVVVMESNNINGWIKHRGYITEDRIMRSIIDNLEGGIDSFKHKNNMYSPIIFKK